MKPFKRRVNNKLRGMFGETDYEKRTIEINKKQHKRARSLAGLPKKDRSLLNTIVHEETHAAHPRMHERAVRKTTRKRVTRMPRKEKNKMYARYV